MSDEQYQRFREGCEARKADGLDHTCPYPFNSEESFDWHAGWHAIDLFISRLNSSRT